MDINSTSQIGAEIIHHDQLTNPRILQINRTKNIIPAASVKILLFFIEKFMGLGKYLTVVLLYDAVQIAKTTEVIPL